MNFDELRKLSAGFQPSTLFNKSIELGVYDALADGGLDAAALAGKIGADPRATRVAANGLTALGILEKSGERYFNTEAASKWLVSTSPDYRGSILLHIMSSWGDYSELDDTWKCGSARCGRKEGSIPSKEEDLTHFILGMENMTREAAPLLAEKLPLSGRKSVLDLGAGPGNYCLAFADRAPAARIVHFDLPPTSGVAQRFVAGKPGAERISFLAGDFLTDPIGEGYDFIWLSQILHMLSEEDARALVGKASAALLPGGVLAVHEHFLNDDMVSPLSAAIFGVHMLAVTKGGRSYSFAEVEEWMEGCGLSRVGRIDYGAPSRVSMGGKN